MGQDEKDGYERLAEALQDIVRMGSTPPPMADESAIAKGERLSAICERAKEALGDKYPPPFRVDEFVS